jgi:four helix bundle protein
MFPRNTINIEYVKQVVRSAASVGANYIEANECLGKKDFLMKLKVCRKEAKESVYWLRLLRELNLTELGTEPDALIAEATELKKIFSSLVLKAGQQESSAR